MTSDIRAWLEQHDLESLTRVFLDNDIGLDILKDLDEQDLKELGISLGQRKRVLKAIGKRSAQPAARPSAGHAVAERRQLTVMFCDLVDSTRLSVRIDPEDLRGVISRFQHCCEQVVGKFGGSVARYMGDGLLVYFGYPIADEYDAERALRAGLEIVRAVGQLNASDDLVLQTRVGIATGEVVVGDLIGEGHSSEHAVIGETPNLAARLQGLAQPDTVVVAATTRKLAGALFDYHDLGEQTLKGFAQPVRAWRVDREVDVESHFEARYGDVETNAILGREQETDALLDRWSRTRDGHGQGVLVVAEAGIGKSRLSLALRTRIEGEPHTVLRYFCAPHHQETALYPVAMQLLRAAGITRADAPEIKLRKIEIMVAQFAQSPEEVVPLYAALLDVPLDGRYPALGISRRLQKENTLAALEAQLFATARQHPVLAVFEDLHWIDPTSLELLERVMARLAEQRIMFIFTARPTFVAPWPASDNSLELHLEKLGQKHVLALIGHVTGGKPLPPAVVKQILEKTDGVPLFVEELTQTLLESGQLREHDDQYVLQGALPDLAIPNTLQDSLMARLDRLGSGKKAAQIGAAIGRMFSHELIARVADFSQEELNLALERLAAAGLVFRTGAPPRADYLFKHALVQDAAYSTLLKNKRRQLHAEIAEALELYFPEVGQHHPETLAHHYTRAGEIATAIPLWETAARAAIDQAAHEEAQRHLNLALQLLNKLPCTEARLQLEVGLQTAMGLALESTRGYAAEEVETAYERARQICEQLDKTAALVPVLLGLYVFNFVRGNFSLAATLVERCVALAKESRRLDYLIESLAALGFVRGHMGDLEASVATFDHAITLYESRPGGGKFSRITAQDPGVAAQALLPVMLLQLGEVDRAERVMGDAFALADQLSRPINMAVAHTHASEFYAMQRNFERAREHGAEGMRIALEHGHDPWYICAMIHTGIAQSAQQANAEGIALAQQGLALWEGAGARVNIAYFQAQTAWCLCIAGQAEEADALMRKAFENCENSKEYLHISMLHQLRGELHLRSPQPDFTAAEKDFRTAIELAAAREARLPQLRATTSLHRLCVLQGRGDETADVLAALIRDFGEQCTLADVTDARAQLQQH